MYYTIDKINYPLWVNKFADKYKKMSDEERNTCMIRYLFDRKPRIKHNSANRIPISNSKFNTIRW